MKRHTFSPGELVARKLSGHVSIDSQLERESNQTRTMWYEDDIGLVLGTGFKHKHLKWKSDLVKVLLSTGVGYAEIQHLKGVQS